MSLPTAPKYPDVAVRLAGEDGNAMAIVARVLGALRKGGATEEDIDAFGYEALSGDYDHVLRTCMAWVKVN